MAGAAAAARGVPSVQPSPAKSAGGKAPAHTHARRVVAEAATAANARGGGSVTGARGQADAVSGAAVLRQGSSARGPGCSDANARDIVANSGLRGDTGAGSTARAVGAARRASDSTSDGDVDSGSEIQAGADDGGARAGAVDCGADAASGWTPIAIPRLAASCANTAIAEATKTACCCAMAAIPAITCIA